MTSEKNIVRAILRYLNSLPECHAEKTHGSPFGKAGKADIRGCYRGRAFQFEVKRPGGEATALQALYLDKWHRVGAITAVVTSVEDVEKVLIESIKDESKG